MNKSLFFYQFVYFCFYNIDLIGINIDYFINWQLIIVINQKIYLLIVTYYKF